MTVLEKSSLGYVRNISSILFEVGIPNVVCGYLSGFCSVTHCFWITVALTSGLDVIKLEFSGRVAQSVTCLATDACLTADPGVASSIPVRFHTFVEIDHEIISTVILLPSADLFKKGCCQLQAKVCARITG